MKLAAYVAMVIWICVPYFLLGRLPIRTPDVMPMTAIDRAIEFNPAWTIVYVSLYLLMPLAAIFDTSRGRIMRYVIALAITSGIASVIFLIWPSAIARPPLTEAPLLYSIIRQIDSPLNACPSLHASFAVLAALAFEARRLLRIAVWTWVMLILYATLSTRQHVLIDLVAGIALACVVWIFVRGIYDTRRSGNL